MYTTRTRVSGDFIEPSTCRVPPSCSAPPPCNSYTTRTRISNDFYEPSGSCFGRSTYVAPSCWPSYSSYVPSLFYNPAPVYPSYPVAARSGASDVVGAVIVCAMLVGIVACAVLTPHCYNEKVCDDIGNGLRKCHFDRVCKSFFKI